MSLPLVAIVGAPNVGKSTLFNRLVGGRRAIVTDEPGVTRDRLQGEVRRAARPFSLVDTGGMTLDDEAPFAKGIERQASAALREATLVLFVVDSRAGLSGLDQEIAEMLRRKGARVLLVANKAESERVERDALDFLLLGLDTPFRISAEHGLGISELLDAIDERLPPAEEEPQAEPVRWLNVAIVGRPNVGKSSLLNRLVGEERVMVSDVPGTTRDAIDTQLVVGDRHYRLIDTAGLRRPGRVRHIVERFSADRAKFNIERCDVALLLLDATQELAAQDTHVAGHLKDAYKPMVVLVNKWDLVEEREAAVKEWEARIRHRLRFAHETPIVFVSALTGQRVSKALERADEVHAMAGIRVPTATLNSWLQAQPVARPTHGNGLRLFYATQTGTHPPRFLMFCNDPKRVHFSAQRQLENSLREVFGFGAAPLAVDFRRRREAREQ